MEIRVKITNVLPEVSGIGKVSGKPWMNQTFIGQTFDQYPRNVAFKVMSDNSGKFKVAVPKVGDDVTISFDIDSKEYNGRWYTEIIPWRIEDGAIETPQAHTEQQNVQQTQYNNTQPQYEQVSGSAPVPDENLPF